MPCHSCCTPIPGPPGPRGKAGPPGPGAVPTEAANLVCKNIVTFSNSTLQYSSPSSGLPLSSNAQFLWCNPVGNVLVSPLDSITKTDCNTDYVQVANGVLGIAPKERLYIYSISQSNYTMPVPVDFNTAMARRYVHCDSDWDNARSEFPAPRTALYNVQVVLNVRNNNNTDLTITFAILNNDVPWSTSTIELSSQSLGTVTMTALFPVTQGDPIAVAVQQFMGAPGFQILARTIVVIEL